MLDNLLTTAQAAARLGIDPATVRRQVIAGRLAIAHRVGTGQHSVLLFDPCELDRYARENQRREKS